MNGKKLFLRYIEMRDDYARELMTIYLNIGEKIYSLLEKAEREGKRLAINEDDLPELWDGFSDAQITLV